MTSRGFLSMDFMANIVGDKTLLTEQEAAYPHKKLLGEDEAARPVVAWVLKDNILYEDIPAIERMKAVAAYLGGKSISLRANRPRTLARISAALSRDVVRVADISFQTAGRA